MSSDDLIIPNPSGYYRPLGSLWTVYGVIRMIMVLCLLIYGRTATLMFGALLSRVPDPFALMDIFHFLYTIMIALSAVSGLVGLVGGLALLVGQRSGRKLALIAAVLSVSDIPLGITLGIYTLVAFLPVKATAYYGRSGHAA
jgi:hypothetical protein